MAAASSPPSAELEQVDRYEFSLQYPGTGLPSSSVDEPAPLGHGHGPSPVMALASAVGHCMSSTLFNSLERAHVPATPMRTNVVAEVGRNPKGRLRVLRLTVAIDVAPRVEADRERFARCVAIFEDYCTVSGAVREGVKIQTQVGPGAAPPEPSGGM